MDTLAAAPRGRTTVGAGALSLLARMEALHPGVSDESIMGRAWTGFNASHSVGAILFGLVYGHLALWQTDLLFSPVSLMAVGMLTLGAPLLLARLYWSAFRWLASPSPSDSFLRDWCSPGPDGGQAMV
jgi:hypothetical protein